MLVRLYTLGTAIDRIRDFEPRLQVFTSSAFGSEIKAFDVDAAIFNDFEEMEFAREVMLQIGRELAPQAPLGYGDRGLLVTFHNTVPNNTLPRLVATAGSRARVLSFTTIFETAT